MNTFIKACVITLGLGLTAQSFANEASTNISVDLRDFILKCAVRPYKYDVNRQKVYDKLRSRCVELTANSNDATLLLGRKHLKANMTESVYSDDGDLFNVQIFDERNEVILSYENIPAFGDILLALAGGEAQFDEVEDLN